MIDFYFDETKAGSMDAFSVEARPALDTPAACLDRLKMNIYLGCAHLGIPCPITGDAGNVVQAQGKQSTVGSTAR